MQAFSGTTWPLKFLGVAGRIELLDGALRACGGRGAEELATHLLRIARARPDSAAVPALIGRWSWLSAGQRADASVLIGADWPALAAYLAADPDALSRTNLARAIGESGAAASGAADTLVRLLADTDDQVAAAAETSFATLLQLRIERVLDARAGALVSAAAAKAVETFDRHRRTGVLRLAIAQGMIGGDPAAHSMRWMDDPAHPAHMVLRGLIRKSEDPAARACAWVWLKHPTLATACAERLARPANLAERSATLERSHLWLNPNRLAGLRSSFRVDHRDFATGGALPRLGEIESLSVAARRGLPAWLEALPITDRQRDAAAAILLTDPEPSVRRALVGVVGAKERPAACLLDLLFDQDASIASSAADAVLSRCASESIAPDHAARLATLLARSVHEPLRHCSAQGRASSPQRRWSIEQVRQLTRQFSAGDRAAVSPRAVASAVASLARPMATPQDDQLARQTLLEAVDLPDARIRANAIEGLLSRGRREASTTPDNAMIEVFTGRAADPHHRVRSNAARGMMVMGWATGDERVSTAGSGLLAQLITDQRVMHRVAGLWLTHRVGPAVAVSGALGGELLDRVAFSLRHAADPMERAWASRARARLERSLRHEWAGRAPALTENAA